VKAYDLNPTTVHEQRELLRVVMCVGIGDSVEFGEEVKRYPPGTSLTVIRADMIGFADDNRGVDYCIDVYSHKGIWERFVHVCYDPAWKIDRATGIILERPSEPHAVSDADMIAAERTKFEAEREKRRVILARRARRGQGKATRTATDH
jgi:hypothetical protein